MATINAWNNRIDNAAITLNSNGNAINISTDAYNTAVNLATGAADKTLTINYATSSNASKTTMVSGSGGIAITATGNISLYKETSGGVTGVYGNHYFGYTADNAQYTVATGAAAKDLYLGSTDTASSTSLLFNTGGFSLASATNTALTIDSSGSVNKPSQPAFAASVGIVTDVTGNGTVYTIIFDTVSFNQGSNYNNTTGVFTAPITGRYSFKCAVYIKDLLAGNELELILVTDNGSYATNFCDPDNMATAANYYSFDMDLLVDMDATDTAYITLMVDGEASDRVDLEEAHFSGCMAC